MRALDDQVNGFLAAHPGFEARAPLNSRYLVALVGDVLGVMRELKEDGMTMLVVSHEMAFAREAADRVVFMADGHIVEQGPPEDLFTNPQHESTRAFLSRYSYGP